ncbi:tetratricopeptide repeat protein [Psychroflexus sediminis]|uniref:Tetratricopeptide repeat-containing protein n=1 Tax=Psychroflexus sediminis TaxID=470826 RepID=A0A1G7U066_9FLAO|nr:tetratricopeptide repeat protein [Psychroflexus sediminis]SDG40932.1 Tetratricopeptide repeat-containing protein [Psychroflexus sediminis]
MRLELPGSFTLKFVLVLMSMLALTLSFGQSEDLAQNYFDQGEYEKAEAIYAKLHRNNPGHQNWLLGYVETLEALEKVEKAESVLKQYLAQVGEYPNIQVELGYLYQKQKDSIAAYRYYQEAISQVEARPGFVYAVGNTFQKYGLLDLAVKAYETAQRIEPRNNNALELAKIYGEQSRYQEMFDNYMNLIMDNPSYFGILNRNFSQYITENSDDEANQALRRVLLQRNQKQPSIIYNQMLSWLFVQQEDYSKAFAQEKAIFQRSESRSLNRLIDLALIAKENDHLSSAKEILEFAVSNAASQRELRSAERELLLIKRRLAQAEDYDKIEVAYANFLAKIGRDRDSFLIQKDFAEFLAFQKKEIGKAQEQIDIIKAQDLYQQQVAELKLLEADLNVQQSRFNQALLLYTQVEKLIPNSDLAREAKFKVAKTSYFTGDFDWALTQLKVLKTSAAQLTSNNALELSLLIKDNSQEDTTRTDLKLVAQADLLQFQNKPEQALDILEKVLEDYKSPSIVDEVLLRIANLHLAKAEIDKALPFLQRIVEDYNDKILADDAKFLLGKLYMDQLDEPEKAKLYFETLIFNHPDSIYFVEARNRFRKLRGDQIQ